MQIKFKKRLYSVIAMIAMASVLVTSIPVEAGSLSTKNTQITNNLIVEEDSVSSLKKVKDSPIDMGDSGLENAKKDVPGYEINEQCREHTTKRYVIIKPASCIKEGVRDVYCERCRNYLGRETYIEPHKYDIEYQRKDSTCTTEGWVRYTCSNCGITSGRIPLEKLPHNYCIEKMVYAANCVEAAWYKKVCACGEASREGLYQKGINNPNNHVNYGHTTEHVDGNCYNYGRYEEHCKCGNVLSSTCDYLYKHGATHSVPYPATCIKGAYSYDICNICSKTLNVHTGLSDPDPNAHSFVEIIVSPTVNEDGLKWDHCVLCLNDYNFVNLGKIDTKTTHEEAERKAIAENYREHSGDPVNNYTGAHEIELTVLASGGTQNISVGINYKSNKTVPGVFGKGFSWNYESYVKEENGLIKLYQSPSSFVEYKKEADDYYVTDTIGYEQDKLYKNADGTITLESNGKTFDYNKDGKLCRLTQKTGEQVVVDYASDNIRLTDGVSGQTITLILNSKGLVSKVTNGTAEAFFEYDDNDYLVKYTDVDGFDTIYTYNENGQVLTATDADGNTYFEDIYDENGQVVEQKDAEGNISFFAYSETENGKETIFTDREGNSRSYVFDYYGRPTLITVEDGNRIEYAYDEKGNRNKVVNPLGNTTLTEYDERSNPVKVTYYEGNVTTYEYDSNDNLIKIVDTLGNEVTYEYDDSNRIISSIDLRGLKTVYEYNSDGQLARTTSGEKTVTYTYENGNVKTVTDACGNVTTFSYDANGHLSETKDALGAVTKQEVSAYGTVLSTTDAYNNVSRIVSNCVDKPLTMIDEDGNVVTCKYDARELLVETTDAKGNKTYYEYDKEERPVKTIYADGTYVITEYDKTGRAVATVDAKGNRSTVLHDALGNVLKSTDKEGNENTFTYTENGKVSTKTDAKGNTTSYEYDCMGRTTKVINPDSGAIVYTYSKAGDVTSVTDPCGNVTTYTYDIYGQRTSQTDPMGNTTTYEYDLNGNVVKTTDALNRSTVYEYDACSRLVRTRYLDAVFANEYDLMGRLTKVTDPNGNVSTRQYDKRGNVVKTTDALGNETSSVYDVNNNLVSATDAKGRTTAYEVNALNQVTSKTDALGLVTSFGYDANGNLNKSVNPMGGVSTSIFDKNGNTVALTGPEGAVTAFSYDANGNLSSRSTVGGNSVKYTYNASDLVETFENARGQNIRYKYDLCGRVTESASPEGTITYTYDANGNVLTVTDKNGTITRTYDALNRVTSITDTKGYVVSYVYDAYGNLSELVYPDNTKATYTYDLCGNIKTVTDFDGKVTSYTYDALNREVRTDNANFTYVIKEYDAVSNLTKMAEYSSKTGSAISETIYEYDADDRLLTETETVKGYSYIYTYDNLDRVIKRTTLNYATGEVTDEETFCYDGAGNITEALSRNELKAMSYIPEDNRISSLNGSAFTFDDDGNLVSGTINGKNATLTYDSRNHLTAYNADTYVYDSEDYRIESTVQTLVKEEKNTWETTKPIVTPVKPGKPVTPIPIPVPKPGKGEIMGAADASEEETFEGSCASVPAGTSSIKDTFETDEEEITSEEDAVSEEPSEETEEPLIEEPATEEPSEDVSGNEITEDDISENDVSSNDIFAEDVSANDTSEGSLSREDLTVAEEVEPLPEEEILPDAEITSSAEDEEVTYTEKTVKTTYCYDRQNKNLLMTVDENGIIEKYVYGNGLISSVETLNITREKTIPKIGTNASTNAVTVTIGSGSGFATLEYKYYTYDIRGSVTRVANSKGTTTTEYSYSTYGNRTSSEELDYSILGYCARDGVLTEANGLLYMRARYYSPDMMRFINEDIVTGDISNSNSLNRYSYVEGNPVTMVDPFGLEPKDAQKMDIFDRISEGFIGLMNAGKGVCMGMEGGAAIGTGIILVLSGPAGWIMGGVMIVGGAYVAICGLADGIEGGHQIVEAVTGTPQDTSNFVRDNVFAWDPDVYYISEALATCGVSELIRSAQGFLPSPNSNNTGAKSNYRGGRLGNEATREQNKEIATFLEEEGYTIVGGGGRTKEEYLPAIDGGRKGSNYVDITAQKGDDIIRINTVDVYANGTITAREQNAANMINQKTGGNIILIPKGSGLGKLPEILHSGN